MGVFKVNLDDQAHKALVVITGNGRVGPRDQVPVDSSREVDVLADAEAPDVQSKAEPPSILADALLDEPQRVLDVPTLERDGRGGAVEQLPEEAAREPDAERTT